MPLNRSAGRAAAPEGVRRSCTRTKAYQSRSNRQVLRKRGIKARIARRGVETSEKLGRHRWVVERTFAWLNQMRRLRIRYERRADIHEAFLHLGCAWVTWRYVQRFC